MEELQLVSNIDREVIESCLGKIQKKFNISRNRLLEILLNHYRLSYLESLPPEIALQILGQLSLKDALAVCAGSKTLSVLCDDVSFWKDMTMKILGRKGTKEELKKKALGKEIVKKYIGKKEKDIDIAQAHKDVEILIENEDYESLGVVSAELRSGTLTSIENLEDIIIENLITVVKERDWDNLTKYTKSYLSIDPAECNYTRKYVSGFGSVIWNILMWKRNQNLELQIAIDFSLWIKNIMLPMLNDIIINCLEKSKNFKTIAKKYVVKTPKGIANKQTEEIAKSTKIIFLKYLNELIDAKRIPGIMMDDVFRTFNSI